MSKRELMEIPAPKFNQHSEVWAGLFFNSLRTHVVARRYDPDEGVWYYQLHLTDVWFIEDALSHRKEEPTT